MKKLLLSLLFSSITYCLSAQMAANNACSTAYNLGTISVTPTTHSSHFYQANQTNVAGGCSDGNKTDVWYRLTMPAGSTTAIIKVTRTSTTTSLSTTNTYIQFFNINTCIPTITNSMGCHDISSPRAYTLTAGSTYLFRVYTTAGGTGSNPSNWNFDVTVSTVNNNECTNAQTMAIGTLYSGATVGATASTGTPAIPAACSGTPDDDVWYKFVATSKKHTVYLNGQLLSTGPKMQVFAGPCGGPTAFTTVGCGDGLINMTDLTVGTTYHVRVFSNGVGAPSAFNSAFDIVVTSPAIVASSRMNEVFYQTLLSPPNLLADPWEITYGPDNKLWVTESKGYKVYQIDPVTGLRTTVLDISQGSTFLSDVSFNCQFANGSGAQGGLAGLALHPKFLDPVAPQNFVYVAYVHSQTSSSVFTNRIVRFQYNTSTGLLESPVSICDTLPGSNDHNSQRMIIAPTVKGGTNYLFYASGDMGAGQFSNTNRTMKAQFPNSYEGKILRFNLVPDGSETGLQAWIPNNNPYNGMLGVQSAVWSIGHRNNQGFAYDTALHLLYGSSHGPYSDDEINILDSFANYGHPLVIGFADGNYNGTTTASTSTSVSAGAAFAAGSGNSSCPPIGSETTRVTEINAMGYGMFKPPLFSAYPGTPGQVAGIWGATPTPNNGGWPSEGWSGLDLYSTSLIPGWKKSLVSASLKWGRLVRLQLSSNGTATLPTNTVSDTISYFGSTNRFRDLAFGPNGRDIYVVMDRSTTTSGPSAAFPVVPACQGCVQKYTFLGYNVNTGDNNKSYIPATITVAPGKTNVFERANQVVINAANNNTNIWVPITDTASNIVAEINAQGYDLDTITTYVYTRTGASRMRSGKKYMNRNLTITPQKQPTGNIWIRLYISKAEYDAFVADGYAGTIAGIKILKNTDSCQTILSTTPVLINPTVAEVFGTNNGYVLQGTISSFSSFYFSNDAITLPVQFITFTGKLTAEKEVELKWEATVDAKHKRFVVEKSLNRTQFTPIGVVEGSDPYQMLDKFPAIGNNFYRVRQEDIDGSITYSKIINVVYNPGYMITLYPNPVKDQLTVRIELPKSDEITIAITDITGRIVYTSNEVMDGLTKDVRINTASLAPQMYIIQISNRKNEILLRQKFVKE
jgi:trimeric autotransporter adhesin